MRLPFLFIFSIASNIVAFLITNYYLPDFIITKDTYTLLTVGALFALLNIFIRPVLRLILSPIIFLTFGIGIILVNATILYLLDFFSGAVTINGISTLLYATLIVGAVNLLLHISAKSV